MGEGTLVLALTFQTALLNKGNKVGSPEGETGVQSRSKRRNARGEHP